MMEIVDIDQYVKNIVGLNGSNDSLGYDDEAFLTKLMGEATSLSNHVENISSFAGSSTQQLFYELLQNANDVKASHFSVSYDDSSILIVNNGAPFQLLPSGKDAKKDDLRAFLAKGKGTKHDDKESIGKYGQGSKLLYNLLTDRSDRNQQEALGQAIIEDHRGIVLFSWSSSLQRQALMTYQEGQSIGFRSDVYNSDFPVLLKIVLTYFPVLPGKEYKINSSSKVLFPLSELEVFSRTLYNFFSAPRINESAFENGSALFILLGEGKGNAVRDAVDDNLISGVRTSLPLLNQRIKSVQFNEKTVTKSSEFYEAQLNILGDKTARVFWPKSLSQVQEKLVNFFQYFPITNEVHGLNLIIDSKEFNIAGSRQNLDFASDYTKLVLKGISDAFIDHIRMLGTTAKETELIALIKAIVKSSLADKTSDNQTVKTLFYDALIPALKENIPTTKGIRNSRNVDCILNTSKVNVDTATLGIENQFWVNDDLQNVASELSSVLEIKIWGISDILKAFTSSDARDKWINNLPEQAYQNIIEELKGLSPARIRELPFLKFSDRKAYSFDEALKNEMLVLLDEKAYPIKEILINSGFIVGGREVLQGGEKGLLEKLASSIPNPSTRWKAIWAKRNTASLQHTDKRQIFRTLRDKWKLPEVYLKDELLLFKNREEKLQPLSKMLKPGHSHATSDILKPFELFPTEQYHDELDKYMMKPKDIWQSVEKNWSILKLYITSQNYLQVLNDLETLFKDRESGTKLDNQECFLNSKGDLVSKDEIFFNTQIHQLELQEYSALASLTEKLTHNLYFLPFDVMTTTKNITFAQLPSSRIADLADKAKKDSSYISESEAKLLFKVKSGPEHFFKSLKIRKFGDDLELFFNQLGTQFYAADAKLSAFLGGKDNYFELPEALYDTFKDDEGLWSDSGSRIDEFAKKLISEFGAEKVFIDLIRKCNEMSKLRYLNKLERFDLNTEEGNYDTDSFEAKLIDLADDLNQTEALRGKTYADNKPLNDLRFREEIPLNGNGLRHKFRLSLLIGRYAAEAGIIDVLLKKFSSREVPSAFLQTESYPIEDITNEILKDRVLSNQERVAFVAALYLTKDPTQFPLLQSLSSLEWNTVDKPSALAALYDHRVRSFDKAIGAYFWHPEKHIYAPSDNSFLLKSEKLPEWASRWVNDDGTASEQKIEFLKSAGLRGKNSFELKFRKAYREDKRLSKAEIRQAVEEYEPKNTLLWLSDTKDKVELKSTKRKLVNLYIDQYVERIKALPDFLLTYNESGRLTFEQVSGIHPALYIHLDKEDAEVIRDAVNKARHTLVDSYDFSEHAEKKLKENNIFPAHIEKEITDANAEGLREWNSSKYREWKSENYSEYSIRIAERAVPLIYLLNHKGNKVKISEQPVETSIRHKRKDDHIVDLIVFQESSKSVLEAIQEAKEELFKDDYKALTDLLAKFTVNDEDQVLLDFIKDKKVTKEKLEELLKGRQSVNEPPQPYIPGSPDSAGVKIDVTEEERQKIENSPEAIKNLINKFDESELAEMSERWQEIKDFMEGTEHKSSPSLLIGYIGEVLVVEWLKRINSALSVEHVTISRKDDRIEQKYTAYDILVTHGSRKFELDVKTTIKPLEEVSKSVAFYVSKRQYDHIADNPDSNYFIFRISLHELGLELFYQTLKRRNLNINYEELINREDRAIRQKVNEFLSDPSKVSLLREHRMYFRLSVPKASNEELPF